MNVTANNFSSFITEFKEKLPLAKLLAFDFELTGIATGLQDQIWDMPYERYAKMRVAANKYNIIQVGLALFIPKNVENFETFSKETYEVRSYNIYVFPRENSEFSPQISCDSSAMEFNIKHGMNWQTWVQEGVTYISKKTCKKMLEKLHKEKEESQQDEGSYTFTESQRKCLDGNIENLEKWINEENSESYLFKENNRLFRSYFYNYLDKHHRELKCDTIKKGNDCFLQVMRFNEAQSKAYNDEKKRAKLEKFESEKGFTRIFEMISESKIPIVGHNCFFDLLFWMGHFHSGLTASYSRFKHFLHKYFPTIYDTKFIGNNCSLKKEFEKSSSLCDYHKSLLKGKLATKNLEFVFPEGFEGYRLDVLENEKEIQADNQVKERYHEAGYDAFLTGISFLHFKKVIDIKNFENFYANKLNVMYSFFNLNCAGNDEFKPNALVFVLLEKIKTNDFKKILREVENAFVEIGDSVMTRASYYENDHPIFISLKDPNDSYQLSEELTNFFNINKKKETFFKILFQLQKKGYNIMSFSKYIENKGMAKIGNKKEEEAFDI